MKIYLCGIAAELTKDAKIASRPFWHIKNQNRMKLIRRKMKKFKGKNYKEWAKIQGFADAGVISRRLRDGWTEEEAILTPKKQVPERLKKNKFSMSSKHRFERNWAEDQID